LENRVKKIRILILSVIVTVALIIGYETFRLVSALKEKRELTAQVVELSEEKTSLENDLLQSNSLLKAAKGNLKSLKKKLSRLQYCLREKTLQETELQGQLSLARVKLETLSLANNFLEKELELDSVQQGLTGLSQPATQEEENRKKASDLKHKVEVNLMPQENKE